jgi:hypothetical protein
VPTQLGRECSVLFSYRVVAVPSAPLHDLRKGATEAVAGYLPLHDPLALAVP